MKKSFLVIFFLGFIIGGYFVFNFYTKEEKFSVKVEKEIDAPVDDVFLQFDNFQNFTHWNALFSTKNKTKINYFLPIEGENSSISFFNSKKDNGEIYIRESKKNNYIKYQFFHSQNKRPLDILVKFKVLSQTKTKITWIISGKQNVNFQNIIDNFTAQDFIQNINNSLTNLKHNLTNQTNVHRKIDQIKLDSIFIENIPNETLLGVNYENFDKRDDLLMGIIHNYNKIHNLISLDYKDDSFSIATLIIKTNSIKQDEVSYFIGFPVSEKQNLSNNVLIFRELNGGKAYSIYYKGKYKYKQMSIDKLKSKVKADGLEINQLREVFMEAPEENRDVLMKFSAKVK